MFNLFAFRMPVVMCKLLRQRSYPQFNNSNDNKNWPSTSEVILWICGLSME